MPNTAADPQVPIAVATSSQISWLALTLTPGLGPTRAKRLVEFFGGVEAVFNASLTELEAAGLPATAAQSLGTENLSNSRTMKSLEQPPRASNALPSMMPRTQPISAKSMIRRLSFGACSPHPQKSASFFPCISTHPKKIPR